MRSAFLLVGGFVLLAIGVGVIALDVPGRWYLGPVLVVGGIVLKVVGLLRDAAPPAPSGGRTKTTLATNPAAQSSRQTGQDSRR